jgi:hypothetical protein
VLPRLARASVSCFCCGEVVVIEFFPSRCEVAGGGGIAGLSASLSTLRTWLQTRAMGLLRAAQPHTGRWALGGMRCWVSYATISDLKHKIEQHMQIPAVEQRLVVGKNS